MSNEKTNLFNISFCNVPDITFFCLFTGTTEEGRRCPQWRRCQRSGTYQSIESHRGSRHSDRLYSRHQYGIYYRRIIRYRLYPPATGQHGEKAGLDFPAQRPYQTKPANDVRKRKIRNLRVIAPSHRKTFQRTSFGRSYQRTESCQSIL